MIISKKALFLWFAGAFATFATGLSLLLPRLAHADTAPLPPASAQIGWFAYFGIAIAAAGGFVKILEVLLAGLTWLAPRTKSTADDTLRDDVRILRDDVKAVLSVVGGLVPAAGVPTQTAEKPTTSALPQNVVSIAKTPAMLLVLLLGTMAVPALTGCGSAGTIATGVEHAVVNCTGQALGTTPGLTVATVIAIANDVAAERAKCTTDGAFSWGCAEQDLLHEGEVIGGCAMVQLFASSGATPATAAGVRVAAAVALDPGRAALEDFRARVAGGATFHTAVGDF